MQHASSKQTSSIFQKEKSLWNVLLLIIVVFFGIILLISLLMGFHPPQPDSPIIQRHGTITTTDRNHHHYHNKNNNDNDNDNDNNNNNEHSLTDSIFVAMPSLNDPDCPSTIVSAYEKAKYPERLYFGIYQQTDLDSYKDCLDFSSLNIKCPHHVICKRLWQIRILRVTSQQAAGPTWGRYMADQLYKNETYYLITDSHTSFRENWDQLLIDLFKITNNDYAIITHYPKGDDLMEKTLSEWEKNPRQASSYHICGTFFEASENHMPRNANGCYAKIKDLTRPIIVPFWAGGFAFSKAHWRNVVPLDPHTKWLFHGEEFHFASRAWTFGYDFYSPPFDILFHRYADKAKRGRMPHSKEIGEIRDASEKRVNYLWGLLEYRTPTEGQKQKANLIDIKKYPLGNKRNLQQFWKFVGIDVYQQNITVFSTEKWANGGLERIPWNDIINDPLLGHNRVLIV